MLLGVCVVCVGLGRVCVVFVGCVVVPGGRSFGGGHWGCLSHVCVWGLFWVGTFVPLCVFGSVVCVPMFRRAGGRVGKRASVL